MHCNCNKVILILVNSPKGVILRGLFSAIIFPVIYEFDLHILHVLCCVMWLYLDKDSVILGSCFERLGASRFYHEHQGSLPITHEQCHQSGAILNSCHEDPGNRDFSKHFLTSKALHLFAVHPPTSYVLSSLIISFLFFLTLFFPPAFSFLSNLVSDKDTEMQWRLITLLPCQIWLYGHISISEVLWE